MHRERARWSGDPKRIKGGAGAICPGRERYGIRRTSSPSLPTARRTRRMESGVAASDARPRERQGTSRVGAGCFPDMHRPNSGTPHPVQFSGPHTRRRLLQCPTRLPERSPTQRTYRARTLRLTSSQGSPEAGFFSRFAFLRASSPLCQSWTGAAARSSHRSSTSGVSPRGSPLREPLAAPLPLTDTHRRPQIRHPRGIPAVRNGKGDGIVQPIVSHTVRVVRGHG